MWRTTLQANFNQTVQVITKCGIYQRDALTPLLFCIDLNPHIEIINKTGYRLQNVSHLLYTDDINLYVRSEQDIDSLNRTTRIYNNNTGMSFRLGKCSQKVTKRGNIVRNEGIPRPEVSFEDIVDCYKYLRIP